MSTVLLAGAGGFIGGHLMRRLLADGHEVTGIDIKPTEQWWQHEPGWWTLVWDLRKPVPLKGFETVINLAADMGGMGFIASHPAACAANARINLNLLEAAAESGVRRYVFASSACVYNTALQSAPWSLLLRETDAIPAEPDDTYGWEKLFSEQACLAFAREHGLSVVLPRIHNCYGPHGSWRDGREKAPAALCRKVAEAVRDGSDTIEIWGDGEQTRSFMWVDDCVEGLVRLVGSGFEGPVNLGSAETVTINELAAMVARAAGAEIGVRHVEGPQGVRGRGSDNTLIRSVLGWEPSTALADGIARLYPWVAGQVAA